MSPLYQIGYNMRNLIAGALALLSVQAASAHSWYDHDCCSDNDCKPISAADVKTLPNGYEVTFAGRVFQVPYDDPRIRSSRDMDYHACEYPREELRCLYVPPGGV